MATPPLLGAHRYAEATDSGSFNERLANGGGAAETSGPLPAEAATGDSTHGRQQQQQPSLPHVASPPNGLMAEASMNFGPTGNDSESDENYEEDVAEEEDDGGADDSGGPAAASSARGPSPRDEPAGGDGSESTSSSEEGSAAIAIEPPAQAPPPGWGAASRASETESSSDSDEEPPARRGGAAGAGPGSASAAAGAAAAGDRVSSRRRRPHADGALRSEVFVIVFEDQQFSMISEPAAMAEFRAWFVRVCSDAVSDDRVFFTISRVDSKPNGAVVVEGLLTGPATVDLIALKPSLESEFLSLNDIGTITVVVGADTGAEPQRADPPPTLTRAGSSGGGGGGEGPPGSPTAAAAASAGGGRRPTKRPADEVFSRMWKGLPSVKATVAEHGSVEWYEMMVNRGSVSAMDGAAPADPRAFCCCEATLKLLCRLSTSERPFPLCRAAILPFPPQAWACFSPRAGRAPAATPSALRCSSSGPRSWAAPPRASTSRAATARGRASSAAPRRPRGGPSGPPCALGPTTAQRSPRKRRRTASWTWEIPLRGSGET